MTWTKQSDDFSDDCWTLSDAAYRLHDEGLIWSNRKLLDLEIPKDDLRRFAKRPEAVDELVSAGFWVEKGDAYLIIHHGGYQRTREQVIAQQAANHANGRKGGRPPKPKPLVKTQSVRESVSSPVSESPTEPSGESPSATPSETQSVTEPVSESPTETGTEGDGSTYVLPQDIYVDNGSRSVGGSGGNASRKRSAENGSGTRLDKDWQPSEDLRTWAEVNCPTLVAERKLGLHTDQFRDYWLGKAGKDGRKSDWPATYRTWLRREEDRAANGARPSPKNASRPSASAAAATQAQSLRRGPRPKKPGDASGSPPRLAASNGDLVIDYDHPESA